MNGMPTMTSIWAVNEMTLVATEVVKMGILSRSSGSMGYFLPTCMRT